MATDAEITTFLCERVLGWTWHKATTPNGLDHWTLEYKGSTLVRGPSDTPNFLSWDGFGLLLTALAKAGKRPAVIHDIYEGATWAGLVRSAETFDPDPKRALMLAAARAYGMEGV